jgi:D-psicose/D-tagatose/L-ribulose 3-epimerase
MKIGMNLLLWTDQADAETVKPLANAIKEWGFDGVELPFFAIEPDAAAKTGKVLDDLGLGRTAVTVRGPDDDPMSADASVRKAGIDAMKAVIDSCEAAGVETLVGPFHSALGQFSGAGPTMDEWERAVESAREVVDYANAKGVAISFEPLNRFEIYLLNTVADAARFVADVGLPNCGLLYDSFHANIEEKSPLEAIRAGKGAINHVHISENDRSTPGSGGVNWRENFEGLKEIGYDGWLTIEAFGQALPALIPATKIWRRMYESEEQLARDGLAFIRREWAVT